MENINKPGYTVHSRHGVSRLSLLVILFYVWYKFRNVLKSARQNQAQFIKRFGFDILIGTETANGLAVYAAFLSQLKLSVVLAFACPKISCTLLISAPLLNRSVAQLCRRS